MSCAILGHEREAVDMIFSIVKRAFTNLPEQIKPVTKTDTVRMLQFTSMYNGQPLDNSIYVALKLRSGTVQKLHVTESAHINDRQELVAGSKQAVPITGSISEETTGNGFNAFYDEYTKAQKIQNPTNLDYKAYFYAWFQNPEYKLPGILTDPTQIEIELKANHKLSDEQLLWRRWKLRDLTLAQKGIGLTGEQLFKQEYPSTALEAFQSGAGHVFDPARLEHVKPSPPLPKDPAIIVPSGLQVWKLPEPGRKYVIGVDPSDGGGGDNGVIDVWDDESIEQVAQWYGQLRPDELAEKTAEVANFYNKAFVGVENNMLSTILFLIKIYDNYYFVHKMDQRTNKRTKEIGWNTNSKTRDIMIDEFIILFDEGNLIINSPHTISEMHTFVRKDNGKREHADGKQDDTVIAAMIAIQMRKFNKSTARSFAHNPLA